MKTNPAKRKTARPRTPAQKAATARMLAANHAKHARTPKQRAARKRANTVPGYYPNPKRKAVKRYKVQYQTAGQAHWFLLASFGSHEKDRAMQYAKALAAQPQSVAHMTKIRVID